MGNTVSIMTIMQDEEEPIRWYLESCAHLAANFPDLKEVVLVDGGSKDRTLGIAKSYADRVPIRIFERPWDFTRAQMNFGLDQCSGDYVMVPDADMTWTTNMADWLKAGWFRSSNYWDFQLLFTARDAYHFFKWPFGPSMRMFKGTLRYDETRKYHVHVNGQYSGIPVAKYPFQNAPGNWVMMFENSCRIRSEKMLLHRGERRQACKADMNAEGGDPGAADRFYAASTAPDTDVETIPAEIAALILPSTNND